MTRFEQDRERIRAAGHLPGVKAMLLRRIDRAEIAALNTKIKRCTKARDAILSRINAEIEEAERKKVRAKLARDLHRSLCRYEGAA